MHSIERQIVLNIDYTIDIIECVYSIDTIYLPNTIDSVAITSTKGGAVKYEVNK